MGWILFLLFVAMPIAEIAVLIQVGGIIGTWSTVGIVVLTAVAGAMLAKMEGRAAMQRLVQATQTGGVPIVPILDAAAVFTGGLLLLTPGFITDILGLSLLFGPTRYLWGRAIGAMSRKHSEGRGQTGRPDDGVIDGVYMEIDPTTPPPNQEPPNPTPGDDVITPPSNGSSRPSTGRPGPSARYEGKE